MESALYAIAQISVTIVGFAALLRAFGKEHTTDAHTDPRLRSLVEQGLVVTLLCFLPALLVGFNVTSHTAARLVSGAAAIWLLKWLYILYSIRDAELSSSIAWRYRFAVVLHIAAFTSFTLSASAVVSKSAESFFLTGVLLMLCTVGWAFLAQFQIERS